MPIEKAIYALELWLCDNRRPQTSWLPAAILAVLAEIKRLRAESRRI